MNRLLCVGILLLALSAASKSITNRIYLVWSPPASGWVTGYELCYGTNSGVYFATNRFAGTNGSVTIIRPPFVTLYFAVTATNIFGRSPFSNEAQWPRRPFNAVELSWDREAWVAIETSDDFRIWTPLTNLLGTNLLMDLSPGRQYFRARSEPPPLTLQIRGLPR